MIRRLKRQTKRRHSVVWPERAPRIRYRHNMTEVVWWEAPASPALLHGWGIVTADDVAGSDYLALTPNPLMYDEPIIGARFSPDVWTP